MIYHYLLEEDSHLSGRIHQGSAPETTSIVRSISANVGQYISTHPLASDLFQRADLLGEEIVREVTETWCRDTNFIINIKDLPDLRNILMRTIIAPQLTAATLIREITLVLPSDVNKQNNQYLRRRCCLIGSFLSVAVCLFGLMRL
jgi:hypothetical protein